MFCMLHIGHGSDIFSSPIENHGHFGCCRLILRAARCSTTIGLAPAVFSRQCSSCTRSRWLPDAHCGVALACLPNCRSAKSICCTLPCICCTSTWCHSVPQAPTKASTGTTAQVRASVCRLQDKSRLSPPMPPQYAPLLLHTCPKRSPMVAPTLLVRSCCPIGGASL